MGIAATSSACALGYTMRPAAWHPVCPGAGQARASDARLEERTPRLAWYGPTDLRDRTRLDAWCATVGDPVLRLAPPGMDDRPAEHLTVAVWNLAVGTADVLAFLREELDYACDGPATTRRGPAHFVLLAQEAWRRSPDIPWAEPSSNIPRALGPGERPGEILDVTEIAERCRLALLYVPSSRNGPGSRNGPREDRGNAILSTLPLSEPSAIELPFEAGRKVAVAAMVQTIEGSVRVVSLHLDVASTLVRTLLSANATRIRQAEALADALDSVSPDVPTVAAGDFNTWSEHETALRRFARRFPESPPIDGTLTRPPFPTDHAFFRRGRSRGIELVPQSYRTVDEPYYSDHHARLLELRTATPNSASEPGSGVSLRGAAEGSR